PPAAVAVPGLLDRAHPRRAGRRRGVRPVHPAVLAGGVQHAGGAGAGVADRAHRPDRARAARVRGGVPAGPAPGHPVAPRVRRRVAVDDPVRDAEVGAGHLPGQLHDLLREALRRTRGGADLPVVDLPGVDRGAAGRLARLVAVRLPLPARLDAPARGLRDLRPAAHARPLRRATARGQGPAHRRPAAAGAAAHRRADPGIPGAVARDRRGGPRRDRRMAAGPRPRRGFHGRPVRGLPVADPDRGGAPAVPRRRAGPGRHCRARRVAPAAARPAAAAGGQCLRRPAAAAGAHPHTQGSAMKPIRMPFLPLLLLACAAAWALAACKPEAPAGAGADAPVATPEPPAAAPAATAGDATVERPSLKVTTVDGQAWDLAAHRGQWVVVNFWATWCAPCRKEMPELSALDAMREHVEVIGLAYEEIEPAALRTFLEEHPVVYPVAIID